MAKSASQPEKESPFDLDKLRELLEMMEKHGLTEISLKHEGEHWRLKRGSTEVPQFIAAPAMPTASVPIAAPPTPVALASEEAAPAPTEAASNLLEIKSPTVGTFYASPTPEDPAFVTVGSKIQADTIVCIVEAMKVFNQIPAEINGTISEFLVADGDAVEFGQPLFKVTPN